jgi:multidrug efflux pump subunit AcrB
MSRTGRKNVAWLCLSTLLFLQLAVGAYACPTPTDRGSSIPWSGQFEFLERATQKLKIVVPATLLIIFVLLYLIFGVLPTRC